MQVRLLTIYSSYTNNTEIPQIRIQGKWLEKLGFREGKKILIQEKHGELLIKLVQIEENNPTE
jgi:toxic protein SymE